MKKLIKILAPALFGICYCTGGGGDIAGTSEQGNARVIASVYASSGKPASGAAIRLRRADYVETLMLSNHSSHNYADMVTDSNGTFAIDSLDTGYYTIEATDRTKEAVLIRFTISGAKPWTIHLNADTLRPFATIKGRIDRNSPFDLHFIQVKGLERLVEISDDGFYSLSDLPAGIFSLRCIGSDSLISPVEITNIVTRPNQITLAPYSGWIFSKDIFLNTTGSSADVAEDVYGFPVLVRLSSANFSFGEAKTDGGDIRFVKATSDSTPLPFEIERWDPSANLAEIWVRTDTVHGNANVKSFVMKWGNPSAQTVSQTKLVFDTSDGFCGVWHLAGRSDAQAQDATSNGYNGTAVNVDAIEGIIGGAGAFTSVKKSYIVMQNTASGKLNFPENGRYSVSTWVNSDSIDYNRVILGKGDMQYYLRIHDFNWRFSDYHSLPSTGWEFTESPYSFGKWVYLCGVRNDTNQYLYVNGVCVDSSKIFDSNDGQRNESFDVELGRRLLPNGSDGLYFSGSIDEVRICNTARDNNWIRLCFMNQSKNDALVQFGN